jgi:DNA-3-methyladenine glycosylase I
VRARASVSLSAIDAFVVSDTLDFSNVLSSLLLDSELDILQNTRRLRTVAPSISREISLSWYCDVAPGHPFHGPYHDFEYGYPRRSDADLFERLVLEINQAGLSWLTILKKRDAFRKAFDGFDVDVVASYGSRDRERLMADASIIRNGLKIDAAIENARRIQLLRAEHGSFAAWLDANHPLTREQWTKLFKQTFKFTGGEIVNEFLMSLGYLPGSHRDDCPAMKRIIAARPPWLDAATVTKTPATKTPARKTPVKQAAAKKTPTKKTPAKKTANKKAPR